MPANIGTGPGSQVPRCRAGDLARWLIAGLMLAYAIVTFDHGALKWTLASLVLFATTLALQGTSWVKVRTCALWLTGFFVLQALLTPLLLGNFVTLPPKMHTTVDIRGVDLPGLRPGLRYISTDERGFRVNPRVDYGAKRGLRIFAIGGSTTEDFYLDDELTWTHLLQERIAERGKSAEVINTGVSGLRAVNHLATLKVVARLDADLVIFLLGANDWNRHIKGQFESERKSWKPVSLRYSALGVVLDSTVISPLRRRITGRTWSDQHRVIEAPGGFPWSQQLALYRSVTHTFRPTEVMAAYVATLREISRVCKASELTCLFMTQPHAYSDATPADLRSLFWMTPAEATYTLDLGSMAHIASLYNEFLKSFAAREGHPVCDLAAGIEPLPRFFFDDLHFTEEGARRVADLVLPCVLKAISSRGSADAILPI